MSEREEPRPAPLERVFGDVLPETTGDDRVDLQENSSDEHDRWLRDNRPPHHDPAG